MRQLLSAVLLSVCILLPAAPAVRAQGDETPAAILVLDASGSMWGQIDGINKIVIAREVIGGMLQDLPVSQAIGLTVYGHRTRGDCADIETLIAPGLDTRAAIAEAVNSINPRGRTPMTASVVEAARALRHTENAATVILVSDGIETCEADPCAIAAELEASGIAFTAHVIGFDVADPEARAQMQCIADNTGGQFLTADNAEELAQALEQVAVAPAPVATPITLRALVEPDMSAPVSPLEWTLFDADGNQVLDPTRAPTLTAQLPPGSYRTQVLRMAQDSEHGASFTVEEGVAQTVTILLPFIPPATHGVTFTARIGGEDGPLITDPVLWDIRPVPDDAAETEEGNGLIFDMANGSYTVSAYWTVQEVSQEVQFIVIDAAREITVVFEEPAVTATIVAPASAIAGSTIEVGWNGPDMPNDYIGIGQEGATGSDAWRNYTYTRDGNPLSLLAPPEPGEHLIGYFLADGRERIGAARITVTPVEATLIAPETARAGDTINVDWTGPDYRNDYIGIGRAEATGSDRWENYTYTREGNPLQLLVPTEPGDYAITYFLDQDRTPLTSVPITVTALETGVTAPATAIAGSTIEVGWTGPDNQNDYIGIGRAEATGSDRWENYTYTREGNPLQLLVPTEPGDYAITYFLDQDRAAQATSVLNVTPVGANLTAPDRAEAGATIEIGWTGPDYHNDYIGIGRADATGSAAWESYAYTRDGSPLRIQVPDEPGAYVIRYFMSQDRTELASRPLIVD
ncbi:VWA domain-containing protein [Rhodophyticola porphyridii]|uniref:VWA domain-containing protein n=1 Tax=Rhodophyticola porphyridii TaxID=1852017 RepID=A0A3L9YI09_9RHOB|nr:VWA domain-containing protein [Rhodophyticola porphyridii]RMA42470.1 VWA domain-containing protein [Rhodophyticola porphyridii]